MHSTDKTCADRVAHEWSKVKEDLTAYMDGTAPNDALGPFIEYALDFCYVPKGTWEDQMHGYWRYQMSWGGPSDEIRFFIDYDDVRDVYPRAEYWFLDWGDGAHLMVDEHCVNWVWDHYLKSGAVRSEFIKSRDRA